MTHSRAALTLPTLRLKHAGLLLGLGLSLLLAPSAPVLAQAGTQAKTQASSAAALNISYLYRAKADDTLRKIAFHFFENPAQTDALPALVAANEWAGKPQAKAGFVLEAGTPVRIPTALMLQNPATARIMQLSGQAQIVRADNTAAPAQLNASLSEGSKLVLGATGRVLLGFPDESRMDVQAGSSVVFSQLRNYKHTDIYLIDVQLEQGRVEASVNPKRELAGRFNVQSRRTVTGVRGTVFRVGDTVGTPAVVEVLKGEVGFSAAGATVAVPNGKGSFLEPSGTPAQPVPLLAAPQWAAGADSALDLAAPLPLKLPAGAVAVILELTGAQEGAITRSVALKASTQLTLPKDFPLGHYSLQAKAVDANGLQGLPMGSKVSFAARPFAPTDVQLGIHKNQLEWKNDAQALLYLVEIFDETAPNQPVLAARTPQPFLDLAPLPAGRYRARVTTVALSVNESAGSVQEKQGMPSAWFSFARP